MAREDGHSGEENKRDSNPSSSHPSVLASNSAYNSHEVRISPDDLLDYIGFGPFQVLIVMRSEISVCTAVMLKQP